MNIQLLDKAKKKKIMHLLEEQYEIKKLPHLFIKSGKDKYRFYSGSLSKQEILKLANNTNIEIIGAKLCKTDNEKARLNFDIIHLPEIKSQIKNIIIIDDKQAEKWTGGEGIELKKPVDWDYVVMENNGDLLGVGRISKDKTYIQNYVPKERRVKK